MPGEETAQLSMYLLVLTTKFATHIADDFLCSNGDYNGIATRKVEARR